MIKHGLQALFWLAVCALILAGVAGLAAPMRPPTARPGERPQAAVAGEELRKGTRDELAAHGFAVLRCIPQIGWCVVAARAGAASVDAPEHAREPNYIYGIPEGERLPGGESPKAAALPCTSGQYQHSLIGSAGAWAGGSGAGVRVAIVDTGSGPHPDLNIVGGASFTGEAGGYNDGHGHGTHTAGIAAGRANAGRCTSGVAYGADILAVRVLTAVGSGSTDAISQGIIWAADNGAKVISMSLGGTGMSQAMNQAGQYARDRGVVLVCAAGNSNTSAPSYPAAYSWCISVAASGAADALASFTNYGSTVDVAAPGENILSTLRTGGYGQMSGTSMAAPVVSGVAALLVGRGASAQAVYDAIGRGVDPINYRDARRIADGGGRTSAAKAALIVGGGQPTAVPTVQVPTPIPGATPVPGGDVLRCVKVNATRNTAEIIPCPGASGDLIVLPLALPNTGHATGRAR